jgi:hypothetical protein
MLYLYQWFNHVAERKLQISHHHNANGCTSLLIMAPKHKHWYTNTLHPSGKHFVLVQAQNTYISSNLCWGHLTAVIKGPDLCKRAVLEYAKCPLATECPFSVL